MKKDITCCPRCGEPSPLQTVYQRKKKKNVPALCRKCSIIVTTERRREIWELFARGMTTKAIAIALRRSDKCIEYHRAELYRELGIDNIACLTRLAIRHGLIEA